MKNKLAKLKYLPNNLNVLEAGDHVICAISGKKINVDKQEAYYSYKEASLQREKENS